MKVTYESTLTPVSVLTNSLKRSMFMLLESHFHNVTWKGFSKDLAKKDFVFVLTCKETSELIGFSTQQILKSSKGEVVVFSGDTIIDPSAWGSLEFVKTWGLWMLSLSEALGNTPLYWLLISKGPRTYRYLPTFFEDFAPSVSRTYSERESSLILDVGIKLFGENLIKNTYGYFHVKHNKESQFLKKHLLDEKTDVVHPSGVFFSNANPMYRSGSELVCLLRYSEDTMKPFCKRLLGLDTQRQEAA